MANSKTSKSRQRSKGSVMLSMTGEEFKRLIEQRDANDIVDTLQEILAAFEGIGDGETIAEYIRRVAVTPDTMPLDSIGTEQLKPGAVCLDDLNEEVSAQHADINEIFSSQTL